MIKSLLLLPVAALMCTAASAQFNYTFKDTTTAYVPLTSAASLNNGAVWYGNSYIAPMPFSWKLDTNISVTGFPLDLTLPGVLSDTGNYSDLNGFLLGDMQIVDRGIFGFGTASPLSYKTVGTAPNRIFKMEIRDAGFVAEAYYYSSLNDFFNLQIWVYETSNIVELHYGPSQISYPGDYFGSGRGPFVAYLDHLDFNNSTVGAYYYVKDSLSHLSIDSLDVSATSVPGNVLRAWPANGKVFRFTPKPPGCRPPAPSFSAGTPTGRAVPYVYNGTTTATDSVVWNFGDGQMLKLTSGYTTPIIHTFPSNGTFNVTVTAYNVCGKDSSAPQQITVFTAGLAGMSALNGVKVYPTPATDVLIIEGLSAGAIATIRSAVGQIVMRAALQSSRETISIGALPAGIYTLLLTDKAGTGGAMQFTKQ